jgi:crossover junction endodeoxyribonuclease RuvC
MFVLGVDPGLSRCGYGAVERRGRAERAVAAGIISTSPQDPVPNRLAELQREVRTLLAELRPDVVAVERVLFSVNVRTAMAVGQASGIVMAEAVAAGCAVVEYSPNEVKEAVAGWGGAGKEEVTTMVQTLLGLDAPLRPADASDAVAIALCHLARTPGRAAGRGPATTRPAGVLR